MKTGVQGRSAVSASRRLPVTTLTGRTLLTTSHSHSTARRDARSSRLRPGHGGSGASCNIRTAAPAAAHASDDAGDGSPRWPRAVPGRAASASTGGLPPPDLRGRDRRHRHRLDLDVGAGLISVDLQEQVADPQRRALAVGDDDLELFHVAHRKGRDGLLLCPRRPRPRSRAGETVASYSARLERDADLRRRRAASSR